MRDKIRTTISTAIAKLDIVGKTGKKLLQGSIASALQEAGFVADQEDRGHFLKAGMPVWRDKDSKQVETTSARRLIDIVVYSNARPVALIETESDLNDLRPSGVTHRNGHYDVFSIARSGSGDHFHSYKSLERMAAAAFYSQLTPYPIPTTAEALLEALRSDVAEVHNPIGLPLFLVSGFCRPHDAGILAPRLKSLGAELICGR